MLHSLNYQGTEFVNSKNLSNEDFFLEQILPRLAGRPDNRYRIAPNFMDLMAKSGLNLIKEDNSLGITLYEIGMQRISNGAVLHPLDPTPTLEALPTKFHEYSSVPNSWGNEPGLMGDEEYSFLSNQLENMCQISQLQKHALAICFGISEYLSPEGEARKGYMFGSAFVSLDGKSLRALADKCILKYASKSEILRHWMKPELWREHVHYFINLYQNRGLDFSQFCNAVSKLKAPKKSWNIIQFLKSRRERKEEEKEIMSVLKKA